LSEAKPIGHTAAVTDYRRNFLPGGSYFFTVNLAERRPAFACMRWQEIAEAIGQSRYPAIGG
jgi:putative transposase